MTQEEFVKKIIDLTLDQVREQGWDLLDAWERDQPDMVYNAIKDELDEIIEDDEDYNDGWRNWNPRDLIGDDEDTDR
jgi:hypothetical protein